MWRTSGDARFARDGFLRNPARVGYPIHDEIAGPGNPSTCFISDVFGRSSQYGVRQSRLGTYQIRPGAYQCSGLPTSHTVIPVHLAYACKVYCIRSPVRRCDSFLSRPTRPAGEQGHIQVFPCRQRVVRSSYRSRAS